STSRGPIHPGYGLDGMIDLHAFSGSNNKSILSELEETIDGPDNSFGYLPRPGDDGTQDIGPLRSRERPGDVRFPGSMTTTRPYAQEVRADPRRLITMVSGVADFSPVPALNNQAKLWNDQRPYAGRYFNSKIRLANCTDASLIPDTYQAFVWALAPLATDEFLTGY